MEELVMWTSQSDTEAIRRQTRDRELISDYITHARSQELHDKRQKKLGIRDAFLAIMVALLGAAMIVVLAFGWFTNQAVAK